MSRVHRTLRPVARAVTRHPLVVVLVALGLTALAALNAAHLRIDTDLANLLPSENETARALMRLRDAVGAESTVDVAIESPSFEANKAFAEVLIPPAQALRYTRTDEQYLPRVDYRRDLRYLERHTLYFATPEELDRLSALIEAQARRVRWLVDPSGPEPPPESEDVPGEDDFRGLLAELGLQEYPISADSTTLVLRFYPGGSQTDVGFIDALYADLDSLIAALRPTSYHPQMEIVTAGRLMRQSVEIHAITDDVRRSFGAGAGAVLLVVMLYFFYKSVQARGGRRVSARVWLAEAVRAPLTAVVLGVPLAMSLLWTGGIAALAFGTLNLLTATLGLVLFGLGIDYGIHFYARYTEERGDGLGPEEAAVATFLHTGPAILASAATTALALFVLIPADFRGFSQFGLIGGLGILFAATAMLTVLPALLRLAERLRLIGLRGGQREERVAASSRLRWARPALAVAAVVSVAALVLGPGVRFEYDFSEMEPEYPEYEARTERVRAVYDAGRYRNPAYLLLSETEDVPTAVASLRALAEQDTLILSVQSLQERFPTDSVSIRQKLDRLAALRAQLDDPFLQLDTTGAVDRLREALAITAPVPLDSVPDFLKRPFTTKSGEVGNFVMVYASGSLSDGLLSMEFADLVGEVDLGDGRTAYAASTPLVAADMQRLMLGEAPTMIAATALLIVLLMIVVFRSVAGTLLSLIPLALGVLWMLGTMALVDLPLCFFNLVVLPAVLGIGNDAGVHIVHRYLEEGRGSMPTVLRSSGEHVGVGALTTLVGFAGLLISFHPGLRSIGQLAVVGIGAIMVVALVVVPALVQTLEDQGWMGRNLAEETPLADGAASLSA